MGEDLFFDVSDEVQDLIKKMLILDQNKRITIKEALNHDWI